MNGIRLHPKFGLAPVMPVCLYCGEDKGEIALLGAAWKGKEEPPMRMLLDKVPCTVCEKKIDDDGYIGFFAECGHAGLIKRSVLMVLLTDDLVKRIGTSKAFGMQKCFSCLGVIPSVKEVNEINKSEG